MEFNVKQYVLPISHRKRYFSVIERDNKCKQINLRSHNRNKRIIFSLTHAFLIAEFSGDFIDDSHRQLTMLTQEQNIKLKKNIDFLSHLTVYLLVSSSKYRYKQFGPRSGPTKHMAGPDLDSNGLTR